MNILTQSLHMRRSVISGRYHLLPLIVLFMIPQILNAQDSPAVNDQAVPTAQIRLGGRYLAAEGIELRVFPDRKSLLEAGLRHGFLIERSDDQGESFMEITRLQAFTPAQWQQAIAAEVEDSETYDLLDLARAFYEDALNDRGGSFDFEQGIAALRQQKADEDFEYAVFMLSSIRESRVAEALGLSFTDATAEAGGEYIYRANTLIPPAVYQVESQDFHIVATEDALDYNQPVFVYEGDGELGFLWPESGMLAGYFIERRGPGETDFAPLNDAPMFNLTGEGFQGVGRGSFYDQEPENYQLYSYRFFGTTMFGERVLFAEVQAMPRDRTPPEQPFLENPRHSAPGEVSLNWQMHDPPAPDLHGFIVARGHSAEGSFEALHEAFLPPETRSFTDTTFIHGRRNYYLVQALDTAGNASVSMPVAVTLIDTIAPAPPAWLDARVDSLGIVRLEVIKGREADLMGYRLFRANDPSHEFSFIKEAFVDSDSLNHQIQTVYHDTITLNSLTPHVYYRMKALDFNYNQSDFSEIIQLARPDTIPPSTPVFKRVINHPGFIELHFAPSESRDVSAHILYRSLSADGPWQEIARPEEGVNMFRDEQAEQGRNYYYSIRALDHGGLYSAWAFPARGRAYDDGRCPEVENFQLIILEDNRISLQWTYPTELSEGDFFVVYRGDEQGRLLQHRRTNLTGYEEVLTGGREYRFAVRFFTAGGGQSPISETLIYTPE